MNRCRVWPRLHIAAFAVALTAWSVALLIPVPHKSARDVLGSDFGIFVFAKTLHVGTYAGLTVLGGTAALFGRKWLWVLPGLIVHGALTEFFQQFTGRSARLEDIGLDTLGITIGGFAVWAIRSFIKSRIAEEPSNLE